MKTLLKIGIFLIGFLALAGCGGGGGGGDGGATTGGGNGGSNQPPAPPSQAPAFSGFNFPLKTDDFWEYRWDFMERSGGQGISTTTTRDQGRFWVTLGSPRVIAGVTAYEVKLFGKSQAPDRRFAPRWKYLALVDSRLVGSEDGTTLKTIFDAQKGSWPGGGFFTEFESSKLVNAKNATLANNYINTAAVSAGRSFSQSECEFFPGIGTICGGDASQTLVENDYYKSGVGPVGYFYGNTFSTCSGGFCSFAEFEHHLGLTAASFNGGSFKFIPESATLHNGPTIAQTTGIPTVIRGDVHEADGGFSTSLVINGQTVPVVIEDWYRITLAAQQTITITLSFEDSPTADVDLYLFSNNIRGPVLHSYSVTDNPAKHIGDETISVTLAAGTYFIAIDGWKTPNGRVPYVLQIE